MTPGSTCVMKLQGRKFIITLFLGLWSLDSGRRRRRRRRRVKRRGGGVLFKVHSCEVAKFRLAANC